MGDHGGLRRDDDLRRRFRLIINLYKDLSKERETKMKEISTFKLVLLYILSALLTIAAGFVLGFSLASAKWWAIVCFIVTLACATTAVYFSFKLTPMRGDKEKDK